jgi:hypothetical protein
MGDVARVLISLRSVGGTGQDEPASYEQKRVNVDMVTNYPQRLTATASTEAPSAASLVNRAVARLGQLVCGMRGHDSVLHFEGKRVMMRCTSCGHDSPGWEVSGRGPRQRFEGDARRHVLAPRRLVFRKTA